MREPDDDWVETATGWAAAIGLNPVAVRWKLRRLDDRLKQLMRKSDERKNHVQYRHRVCAECGAVQDREATQCTRCAAKLGARWFELLRRLGLSLPRFSLSMVLGLLMTICYARLIQSSPDAGFEVLFTMDSTVLFVHGSWVPSRFLAGDWWRIVTAMFLHIGMWHAAFNLYALSVVGPHIEEMYGRGKTLFFFLLTGALANAISGYFSQVGNAGASGALMGLIGLAAARGHRSKTRYGREVRDIMLTWLVYTMLFGFFIGADNWAHGGGFAVGAALGLVVSPRWFERAPGKQVGTLLGAVGVVTTLVAVYLVLWPPLLSEV